MRINEKHKSIVENRNYIYIGTYDTNEIMLDSNKLRKPRTRYVRVKCKYCNHSYDIQLGAFKNGSECRYCCNKYENSFAYYIEVELGLNINDIWDFTLNNVNPRCLSKFSHKKVWIKCLDKNYHKYQMTCANFSNGQRCSYCNSFASHKVNYFDSVGFLYHNIAKAIVEDERNNVTYEDMYKISPKSHNKFYFKCDSCKRSSHKKPLYSIRQEYRCKYCSDGISIPEKFVGNTLQRLNIKFETHKRFKWSDNKEYDFYIPSLNMIIETHGLQHYKRSFEKLSGRARTLEEEQANDKYKKELAITNGIENYIIVDCRYSKLDWLKENTIKELSLYFDLSNVIWSNIWKESQKSLVAKVLQMYENGMSVDEISDSIKLSKYTISEYLKYKK